MRKLTKPLAALTAAAAALALAGGTAQAKVYEATGKGTDDPSIGITIQLDAKAKKGKLKQANTIAAVGAENMPFECAVTQTSGRSDDFGFVPEDLKIAKNGKFDHVHSEVYGGYETYRHTISGKVTGKGKSAVIKGEVQFEQGAGGIKFGSCVTPEVPFVAKAKL